MILCDTEILKAITDKTIVISPFDSSKLGANSYDVHLSRYLAVYEDIELDAKKDNPLRRFEIQSDGFVLLPGELYLGSTFEYTETHAHIPFLEGKSSVGRLGIDIHATAGKGDIGFCNYWTLEISVSRPVRIYEKMPIGQLIFFAVQGTPQQSYSTRPSSKYTGVSPLPQPSQMWKNSF